MYHVLKRMASFLVYGLGAGAVEFIIEHAEISIAFAEEKKIPEVHMLSLLTLLSHYYPYT